MKKNKKKMSALAALILAILGIFMFSRGATLYKATEIPFPYDPNMVQYKLLGGIQGRANTDFVYDVNCYDPDGDPFVVGILGPPANMTITENTTTGKWDIGWRPEIPGIYYVDVEAIDIPPPPLTPLSARGTIIFNVLVGNRPPELIPR